jgi:phosphopantetheine--protein transferase-like protein
MHSIGNDIVDLNLAKVESNWQRKGFLEKQFTKTEQEEIHTSEDPFFKVWLFWSMKEAAYKCYTQSVKKRFFAPKQFECSLLSWNQGVVVFKEIKFYTSSSFDALCLHTIASEAQEEIKLFSSVLATEELNRAVKERLAALTGIAAEEIEKRKTEVGAPLFYHKKKRLTKACSLSHHGIYGAYLFCLQN